MAKYLGPPPRLTVLGMSAPLSQEEEDAGMDDLRRTSTAQSCNPRHVRQRYLEGPGGEVTRCSHAEQKLMDRLGVTRLGK